MAPANMLSSLPITVLVKNPVLGPLLERYDVSLIYSQTERARLMFSVGF